jgi:CCR4-NOT transcription complex subunit 2
MFTPNRAPGYFDNVRNADSLRKVPSFDPEPKSMLSYPPYFEQYPPIYAPRMNMDYNQGYIGSAEFESSEDFPSLITSRPPGFSNEDFYPPPGFSKPLKTKAPNPNAVSFIPSYLAGPPQRDEKEELESKEYGIRGVLPLQKNLPEDKKILANGKDLSLELNKKNHENLCSYFHSALIDKEIDNFESPEFTLPQSYYISKPILKQKMVKQYQDGTLFYIFYSMPGEYLQSIVADLLYQRNWVYDPQKQAWFSCNAGEWKTFDINKFDIVSTQVQTGPFLTKDEVTVKQRT